MHDKIESNRNEHFMLTLFSGCCCCCCCVRVSSSCHIRLYCIRFAFKILFDCFLTLTHSDTVLVPFYTGCPKNVNGMDDKVWTWCCCSVKKRVKTTTTNKKKCERVSEKFEGKRSIWMSNFAVDLWPKRALKRKHRCSGWRFFLSHTFFTFVRFFCAAPLFLSKGQSNC